MILYLLSQPNGVNMEMDQLEVGTKPAIFLNCNSVYGRNFQVGMDRWEDFEKKYSAWSSPHHHLGGLHE